MISLHECGQSIKKDLRAFERVHVQPGMTVRNIRVRIEHHGGNTVAVSFKAQQPAIAGGNRPGNHDGANMPAPQDLQGGFSGGNRNHPVTRMRQYGVANGGQHSLRRNGQNGRSSHLSPVSWID